MYFSPGSFMARFEVLMETTVKMVVFWDVEPISIYQTALW